MFFVVKGWASFCDEFYEAEEEKSLQCPKSLFNFSLEAIMYLIIGVSRVLAQKPIVR
jgi:hypothetical protein